MPQQPSGSDQPLHVLVTDCLQSHDPALWEILVQRLQPLFARTVYRVASSSARPDEVDDLVQESFLKLRTALPGAIRHAAFEDEPAAFAYFKMLAANTARDYFKSRTAEKRGAAQTISAADRLPEIVATTAAHPDRDLLMSQIDNALDADPPARAIFWLYYRQGFTAREIAAIPAFNLSVKGVESLLHRLTAAVRQKINPPEPEGKAGRASFS